MEQYNHQEIEVKWQKVWDKSDLYKAEDFSKKPKYYCMIEFPYPSGDGLHVGHCRSYTALDILARKKRMEGNNVLFPIGWDAFGLPAENYAIKTGQHPKVTTEKNIATFSRQLKSLGYSFDWSREINTSDPNYYKWTQWIFLKLFEKNLAYKTKMDINWCTKCNVGLANEEVVNNLCERCGGEVYHREREQWMLKITAYADRLLEDLDKVNYLEKIKKQQSDWIGKSYGAQVVFKVISKSSLPKDKDYFLPVYTTRPDTLFGCTYMVVAPEHEVIQKFADQIDNYDEVLDYIEQTKKKTEMERTNLEKTKTGIELHGLKASNPVTKEEIPIFAADYVLATYGTGAIMAVPAHDQRDYDFAKKYNLEIRPVISPDLGSIDADSKINKMFSLVDEITDKFKKEKIKIWFIGTFAVSAYRQKMFAYPADIDFGVLEKHFPDANKILVGLGYKLIEEKVNEKFKHNVYKKGDVIVQVGTFDKDLGDKELNFCGVKYPVSDASWLAECYKITAPKERRKGKNDLERAIFLDIIAGKIPNQAWEGDGTLINSDFLNGLNVQQATDKMIDWLEERELGFETTNYHLRDWVFSRQRYWGEPIPIIICPECGYVPVPEKDLPVVLPEIKNYLTTENGDSPLALIEDWVNVECPKCGGDAKRETDTMPNWAGSSWYFLRYTDPRNNKVLADFKKLKYWTPVDWYNGGMEHTTLHLLYSRFWHKFLFDLGVVPTPEPYAKRTSHGLILGEDGEKMSKSRGNVVNPDDVVGQVGADTFRVYEMFMGPFDQPTPWSTQGVTGVRRFMEKVWQIGNNLDDKKRTGNDDLVRLLNKTIKQVTEQIETLDLNTCISAMMILVNKFQAEGCDKKMFEDFLKILSPFAPHLGEELWQKLGHKKSIFLEKWPAFDSKLIKDEAIEIPVQINGKVRAKIFITADESEGEIKKKALTDENVKKYLNGGEAKKIIYVKGKIINIVI
ncbi:MAG: class I tRNA ligase family protein [Patescibacteria group bacterium]|nr:class I tRNA ligase family protein [Patescibacteria group bacterium]